MSLNNKHILLAVTGSIAAYKTAFLIRLLKKEGATVQVLMSESARDFISPLTLATLSGNPVISEFSDQENGTWNNHVKMGMEADLYLIAPATANTIARMASGICDHIMLAAYLSARCPVVVAPAMDLDMYRHPSTRANLETLIAHGVHVIDAESGELASGLFGEGRMAEPENMMGYLKRFLKSESGLDLTGRTILISAGPTREPIDPVRFISNHSSGKMGYALAEVAAGAGAKVILVSGPTHMQVVHPAIRLVAVESAQEMFQACKKHFPKVDIALMAAAVADYAPQTRSEGKIKKAGAEMTLKLVENPDIAAHLGGMKKKNQVVIGFALETDNELSNARKKLEKKNLDMVVLNSLNDENAGFGTDTNKVTIIGRNNKTKSFGLKPKTEVASDILQHIIKPVYDKVS
ncbi:MAG: bifunctional phosphopantothenoylcysteine decarboxylase/phosphopantothenate--cysteine ligase CoaBC [Flavobacteriales bacterium]|nr:bifunctional phosphopantothenoylcysteine decarboxylase/phosphopantothenate--cysteine ligase CoaBC [Flavobacteriales bacterium]